MTHPHNLQAGHGKDHGPVILQSLHSVSNQRYVSFTPYDCLLSNKGSAEKWITCPSSSDSASCGTLLPYSCSRDS